MKAPFNKCWLFLQDQKVSWHATPFEERLEKALSEESVITQKYACFLRCGLLCEYDFKVNC